MAWLVIAVCAGMSLLFAACNYALRTFNRIRLEEELSLRGRKGMLEPALTHVGSLIWATATLRILFNIALILTLSHVLRGWAADRPTLHLLLVGLVALGLVLLFSMAVPNALAKYAGEPLLCRMLPLLQAFRGALGPVVLPLRWVDEIIRRLAGAPAVRDDQEHVETQILSVVSQAEREGIMAPEEREMIRSVLSFQDLRVDQVMVPRTEIVALDVTAGLPGILQTFRQSGHSRIPVFEGSLDNIVGILFAKDLLWAMGEAGDAGPAIDARRVMRPPFFVPESKLLGDLLAELRQRKVHLAVVLDEFGGTAGLVTIEDALEEIVGEIADEYDRAVPALIRQVGELVYELDGRVRVHDLNDELGLALPETEDYDTVSGLVIAQLGHIPKSGEQVQRDNLTITVTQAEPRRINRLRLEIPRPRD